MKTLANQTLLFDEDCPLCNAYTAGFIKAGMLDENGRKPYNSLTEADCQFVDANRARNEIALVDYQNKTVTYGVDSLLKVIGNSFPVIEKVGKAKPVYWFLKKLYSFISYNRKVIIPNKKTAEGSLQCIPDFKYGYRMAYIVLATLITAAVLYNYSALITTLPVGNFSRELILAVSQMIFQGMFLIGRDRKITLNYMGNLITVSLMGSLLLLPILLLSGFIAIPQMVILGWFLLTAAIMFIEHYRRIKLLGLPRYLCFTWVLYRVIALGIILNL